MTAHLLMLAPLFGGRSRISDVLSVKREISKAQAMALSAFFKVPADLFIQTRFPALKSLLYD
jgi:antitoxin component HigA of HigAB toxin-antitoxin module